MKAFLLAAGLGTRLRPLTYSVPKCIVLVNKKPLIQYWLESFYQYGIRDVLVNLHYRPELVKNAISKIREENPHLRKIEIVFAEEDSLLGTSGTIKQNEWFIEGESKFFVCYGDNLTDMDLAQLDRLHCMNYSRCSIALIKSHNPREKGVVEIDEHNRIISFVEKPELPRSDLTSAGIYCLNPSVVDDIPEGVSDFGRDVFPQLVANGGMKGFDINFSYFWDIGSLETYREAQRVMRGLGIEIDSSEAQ